MCAGMEFQDRLSLKSEGQKIIKNAPFCVTVKKKDDVYRLSEKTHKKLVGSGERNKGTAEMGTFTLYLFCTVKKIF